MTIGALFINYKNPFLQEHQTHQADVLSLAVTPNGKSVFAGSVDNFIQQFDLVTVDVEGKEKQWKATTRLSGNRHTHDIKALIILPDQYRLVSAGGLCVTVFRLQVVGLESRQL